MATDKETPTIAPLHFATPEQTAALQRQADLAALGGRRLDETQPGGRYVGGDNEFHDSYGRKLTKDGGVVVQVTQDPAMLAGTPEHLDRLAAAHVAAVKGQEPGTGAQELQPGIGAVVRTTFTGAQESSEQKPQAANLPGDPPGVALPKEIQKQVDRREYDDMPQNELEVEIARRGIRNIKGTGEKRDGSNKASVTREDLVKALTQYDSDLKKG